MKKIWNPFSWKWFGKRERSVSDMVALIRAERLKMRHSFARICPLSAVLVQILISLCLSRGTAYYSVNAWNWWYTMILPGMLAILCTIGMQKEKRQRYANFLTTQISPAKCWCGKIACYAGQLLYANLLIFLGVSVGGILIGTTIPPLDSLAAALLLTVCYLWEIPLYMMLSVRFGMFASIFACMAVTVGSLVTLGASRLWWICPASIPFRLMCPVLQIMPNGLIVEAGSHYMSAAVILPGAVLSMLWFAALTFVTARWFGNTH
ncbi:MAG: lantibiotic immunity ABC transporter MutE/EpiE family permease subunit [Eubacterium sp.]|nr:lantibiotic immunity ABC transporter MutE/EpiE family permease subunit [Eubacterium sp.]